MPISRNIVITGAGRGIGLELVRMALKSGDHVFAGVRRKQASLELKSLAETDGGLKILELDVSNDASVHKFRTELEAQKPGRIDVLINNAGIYGDDDKKIADTKIETLLSTLNTNTLGAVRVTQALLPLLRQAKPAIVANITSLMGSIGDNSSGGALGYRMSKAALNMFTKNLSIEEKDIVSICLHPGWVKTDMGGPGAPLEKSASAEGLWQRINGAKGADTGKFYSYTGRELPW